MSPEDQRDTTVPSTLLRPAVITSPICPLCPCAQFFWERWASLKPSRFLFTMEKIGAFAGNKCFAFPFPSYHGVSDVRFPFPSYSGVLRTMEAFQQGFRFPVSKLPRFLFTIEIVGAFAYISSFPFDKYSGLRFTVLEAR